MNDKLAVFAELVDPPGANGQLVRDLGHFEQPIAASPEDLQVRERGRPAGPLSRLRRPRDALPSAAAAIDFAPRRSGGSGPKLRRSISLLRYVDERCP